MSKIVIEGIDFTGKDLLIKNLQNVLGCYPVIHHTKPLVLGCYNDNKKYSDHPLLTYQKETFKNMFNLLKAPNVNIMMNRAHLGECVYAPRYRNYNGDYVFDYEKEYHIDTLYDIFLILLVCSNTSIMIDDGNSHDFSKKDEEQNDFIVAYEKSKITHKFMIDVYDNKNNTYKKPEVILEQVLRFFKIKHARTDFRVI